MSHYLKDNMTTFKIICFLVACFCSQVIGVAVFFALLLKPVAVEESEEIEQVMLGKKNIMQPVCYQRGFGCTGS